MNLRCYSGILATLVGCVLLMGSSTPLSAQGDKKAAEKEKLVELEKKLLTVPADIKERDEWQKAWRERLIISLNSSGGKFSKVNGLSIENKSPCAIKIDKALLDGFTRNGTKLAKGKEDAEWLVKPTQKLLVASQSKVQVNPLVPKKKALILALITGQICKIEVQPVNTDLKPVELAVVARYGEDENGKVVTGQFLLCKPDEVEQVLKLFD